MQEEKLEQLRKVFYTMINDVISKAKLRQEYFESEDDLKKIVDGLIYEVKIRISDKIDQKETALFQ